MTIKLKSAPARGWWPMVALPLTLVLLSGGPANAQNTVRTIQAPAPYDGCNVRSSAGMQYTILETYRNGTAVTLLGESGRGWYRIQVEQVTGWIARQCIGL